MTCALCPEGCGCRLGTDDADRFECGCTGPCTGGGEPGDEPSELRLPDDDPDSDPGAGDAEDGAQ